MVEGEDTGCLVVLDKKGLYQVTDPWELWDQLWDRRVHARPRWFLQVGVPRVQFRRIEYPDDTSTFVTECVSDNDSECDGEEDDDDSDNDLEIVDEQSGTADSSVTT